MTKDTVLYGQLEGLHGRSGDDHSCGCGARLEPPAWLAELDPKEAYEESHRAHVMAIKQAWLVNKGYVMPEVMWAICAYCGCIVGALDIHRESCP